MKGEKTSDHEVKSANNLIETLGVYIILIVIFYILGKFGYLDDRTTEAFSWLIILSLIVILIIGIPIFIFRGRFKPDKSLD